VYVEYLLIAFRDLSAPEGTCHEGSVRGSGVPLMRHTPTNQMLADWLILIQSPDGGATPGAVVAGGPGSRDEDGNVWPSPQVKSGGIPAYLIGAAGSVD
jgi:hypothetical protein